MKKAICKHGHSLTLPGSRTKDGKCRLCRRRHERESKRRWAKAHPELAREKESRRGRRYYARHRDEILTDAFRERMREYDRLQRRFFPHLVREQMNKHRAKVAGVEHRPYSVARLWADAGGNCQLCGLANHNKRLHVAHLVPLSKGGPDAPENIAALCEHCNAAAAKKAITRTNVGDVIRRSLQLRLKRIFRDF